MSDIENIVFATTTPLTSGTDNVVGTGGSNLVLGELADGGNAGLNTLNPSDVINGGGGEDMLRVTATGPSPSGVGFTMNAVEIAQIRNFSTGNTLDLDFINVQGTNTFWLDNTTGQTNVENIQNAADILVTGGPNGDPAEARFNFNDSLYQGDNDSVDIEVNDANADIELNDYEDAGRIEHVNIIANGAKSDLELDIEGQDTWTITGNASDLEISQEDYNYFSEGLSSIDATGFAGNLELDAQIAQNQGSGPATVTTIAGDDELYLWGLSPQSDGSPALFTETLSDVFIKTANGSDYIEADHFQNVTVQSGNGEDTVSLGDESAIQGNVDLTTGANSDDAYVNTSGNLTNALLGKGNDTLDMDVSGSATVGAAQGSDSISGSVGGNLFAKLGAGNNSLGDEGAVTVGSTLTVNAGAGNDTVNASVGQNITATLGDGNNDININYGFNSIFENVANITTGSGADSLVASNSSGDELIANLGGGNDYADITGVSTTSANITFDGGDDTLETNGRGVVSSDTISFGDGNDTLITDALEVVNDANDFSGVTSLETLSFGQGSGDVTFDGITTGANDAGVINYVSTGSVSHSYDLVDLSDGVNLSMDVQNASGETLELDLDDAEGGTANISLSAAFGSGGFNDVYITDTSTLNITAGDYNIFPDFSTATIDFGSNSFNGDTDLTTVNLTGNANINLASSDSVFAGSLATINGTNMVGAVYMTLADVAAVINIDTGAGSDYVEGNDSATAYDVSTRGGNDEIDTNDLNDTIDAGDGNDEVNSGGGNDNIKLGAGDDIANFAAGELTSFDSIDGGSGADEVVVESALGTIVDDFFFNWQNVETLRLSNGTDNLTLNDIANQNGPSNIYLGGGSDTVTLGSGYARTLNVYLAPVGSADNIDASGTTNNLATLKIHGNVTDFNGDTLKGGTSLGDELIMTADNGTAALTDNVTGIDKITVLFNGSADATITTTAGTNTGQMTVDASLLVDPIGVALPGDLTFTGAGNNPFVVTGGQGNDTITTGGGNDTINGGLGNDSITAGNGANSVNGGSGNDIIDTGSGNDTVNGDDGNDNITSGGGTDTVNGGAGDDAIITGVGADTVVGGSGNDTITGGNDADNLTGGANDDTFVYADPNQSRGGNGSVDTITDFDQAGNDLIDFTALYGGTVDGTDFLGNQAFGTAQSVLTQSTGEIVYEQGNGNNNGTLWVDDGNGILNGLDLQIKMTGVPSMEAGDFVAIV